MSETRILDSGSESRTFSGRDLHPSTSSGNEAGHPVEGVRRLWAGPRWAGLGWTGLDCAALSTPRGPQPVDRAAKSGLLL